MGCKGKGRNIGNSWLAECFGMEFFIDLRSLMDGGCIPSKREVI